MGRQMHHPIVFFAMMVMLSVAWSQDIPTTAADSLPQQSIRVESLIKDPLPEGHLSGFEATSVIDPNPEPHSPRKAFLLSILPGAGQIYNGQAWKVPIIYTAFAITGYYMYFNHREMKKFRDEYLLRVNGGTPQLDGYTNYPDNSIYNYYLSYNQNFQLTIILSVMFYSLNLLDAFVYGHLYEFQITDDLSLNLRPSMQPVAVDGGFSSFAPSVSCSLRF